MGLTYQARRILSIVSASAVLGLLSFHLWLLGTRAWAGRLLEPAEALRWTSGVLLFAALLALQRAGVSLVRGRKALVLWVLVLLIHWSASNPSFDGTLELTARTPAETLLVVLPPPVLPLLLALALLFTGALGAAALRPPRPRATVTGEPWPDALVGALLAPLSPRPPPAA